MMHTLFAVFSPLLASGAVVAAVGLPLVVHLLFRKRYQIVPWAAIRFLIVAERRHKRRIDQWLLLALRVLALGLFLFAMIATTDWAEKIWQAVKPGSTETVANVPRTHHVIVLDASLSMTAKGDDGRTRFDRAVEQIETMIRSGNPGDGYTLIRMTGTAEPVVPGPAADPEKVVAELRKVKVTHGPADHTAALATVADVLTRSPRAYPRRQLTFFTDLQRASWANAIPRPENTTAEAWQRIVSRADVALMDTARGEPDNLAVSEIALSEPMPLVNQPVSVTVTVANLGRAERKNVRVDLLLGRPSGGSDALVSVAQKSVEAIPAGGRGSVKFDLTGAHALRDRGVHVIQAKLVDGDDLPADDTRALAVEVRDGLHALLVEGKADPDPKRRAAMFLSHALFPPDAKPTLTPNRPRTVSPADFLDPNVCDLAGVDCVFFCDVANPTADHAAKLEAVLRRGGTVVIVLGPNAAASRARYNEVLFRDGTGVLPGAVGDAVTNANPDDSFRFFAEEEEYRRMPLAPFSADVARGGLINVPFFSYTKLDAPADGRARRILSFARASAPDPKVDPKADPKVEPKRPGAKPDPALVEWSKHRGRVYVFTSALNEDWSYWPASSSYLQFWHEFLAYSVANPDRHTVRAGDPLEEFFPASSAGLNVGLTGPGGLSTEIPLVLQDEAGVARFGHTALSGLYRMGLNGARDRVFAVNVAEFVPGGANESDLSQLKPEAFKTVGPVQIVGDAADVKPTSASGADVTTQPKPHGPLLARVAVLLAVLILMSELLIAWQFGPARSGAAGGAPAKPAGARRLWRALGTLAALLPLALAALVLFTVVHADRTGNPLGFLPHDTRAAIETAAGVPAAAPGEGTKWRLDTFPAFFRNIVTYRRVVLALALVCVALTVGAYWAERRAAGGFGRLFVPALLRTSVFLLALFVLLGQLRLAFDREGLPEVVILLDTSASMARVDEFKDPAVRAKAEELVGASNLSEANRLKLAQLLLTRKDADWLDKLLREKQVKVHLYAVDAQTRQLTAIDEESQLESGRAAVTGLKPEGESSHLGDGVEAVLKAFRGSPLAAIIMFTDGVTTGGTDLPRAARAASLDGVPLFLVGVGDTWETPDLALTDPQSEDVVGRGDRIAFEARLTAHGDVSAGPVTVFLKEKVPGGKLEDRGQTTVTADPTGNPVPVAIGYTPTEAGEKTFVLVVPGAPGETNLRNNQIERTVLVTDSRKIRVLYVEGYPRYDWRFVKVMLERESDKSIGGKAVEVKVLLLDAAKGWAGTDRSAFGEEFPNRTELFGFDAVILGDVDPKQVPKSGQALRDLADFVKQKGGGLLFLSGEHGTPAAYADTPLADVLPVVPSDAPMVARAPEETPLTEEYQPKLTPAGRIHPLFRFSSNEAESARVWGNLRPLFWYAKGYRRKPLTNVLVTHPTRPAEGGGPNENHPLVIQQFAGAGPVLFFGFDDTWRWRFRSDEEHFDRFWMQAVRVLSRSRARRPELHVLPKTEFRRGERVTVQVRYPIEAPAPAGGAPVRVSVTRAPLAKPDGTPGPGATETATLVLNRTPDAAAVQFEATLPRAPEGEYRFEMIDPEVPGGRPWATARVLPPMSERERTEMNRADLVAAAKISGGEFYTLANATDVFNDLKNLQRVPLNQPCSPVPLWNQPAVYGLLIVLLLGEWLLRKRERLL
ncbi:MAG: VWA domain-containing protein [Planctomycetes bacterium]|nr:VWA domain-containing protein [Planctomycetota bacterium]